MYNILCFQYYVNKIISTIICKLYYVVCFMLNKICKQYYVYMQIKGSDVLFQWF